MFDYLIIGGGASGIVSAILLAEKGFSVAIAEKENRIGKKLLATGNGKCNFTNTNLSPDKFNNSSFVSYCVQGFGYSNIIHFFNKLGLLHKIDGQGRVYPLTDMAESVLDVLRFKLDFLNVKVFTNCFIESIEKDGTQFSAMYGGGKLCAKKIVLTSGNEAINLYKPFGHKKTELRPALCSLKVNSEDIKGLANLRVDAEVKTECHSERGEILFKENAISGICIFNTSVFLARERVKRTKIVIDLFPTMTLPELEIELENRLKRTHLKGVYYAGLCHKNIWRNVLNRAKLSNPEQKDSKEIAKILKNYEIEMVGYLVNNQIVCGGLETCDFDNKTFESRLKHNIFALGEALDIDGECGGYNLSFAFASALSFAQHQK